MNPSPALPELLVRGKRTQSIASSVDFERLSIESPLEHYRFCRSLLNQARHSNNSSDFLHAFEAALRCPCAKRYQPSMAALAVLSRILGKSVEPLSAQLFSSKAPMGDKEEIDQNYRLLPIPIARELSQLWEELGLLEKNDQLINLANDAKQWVERWGNNVDPLFYREMEFDKTNDLIPKATLENSFGTDDFLGIARLSTPSTHAAFTLSGWNTGLGVLKFGEVEIPALGPQGFPLSESGGFGLAQIGAHQPVIATNSEQLSLSGWSRCFHDKEIWLSVNAMANAQTVCVDVRFVGIKSCSMSDLSAKAPLAMVFYVRASTCTLEDGSLLHPKGLQRFQGNGQKIIFDHHLQLECSKILKLQIIPLAGSGCFWNATFLVAFEFNPSQEQAAFTFRF